MSENTKNELQRNGRGLRSRQVEEHASIISCILYYTKKKSCILCLLDTADFLELYDFHRKALIKAESRV